MPSNWNKRKPSKAQIITILRVLLNYWGFVIVIFTTRVLKEALWSHVTCISFWFQCTVLGCRLMQSDGSHNCKDNANQLLALRHQSRILLDGQMISAFPFWPKGGTRALLMKTWAGGREVDSLWGWVLNVDSHMCAGCPTSPARQRSPFMCIQWIWFFFSTPANRSLSNWVQHRYLVLFQMLQHFSHHPCPKHISWVILSTLGWCVSWEHLKCLLPGQQCWSLYEQNYLGASDFTDYEGALNTLLTHTHASLDV